MSNPTIIALNFGPFVFRITFQRGLSDEQFSRTEASLRNIFGAETTKSPDIWQAAITQIIDVLKEVEQATGQCAILETDPPLDPPAKIWFPKQ